VSYKTHGIFIIGAKSYGGIMPMLYKASHEFNTPKLNVCRYFLQTSPISQAAGDK
jgi:hypothetical protein